MFERLRGWLRPRWSVVLFWAVDLQGDPIVAEGRVASTSSGAAALKTVLPLPRGLAMRRAPWARMRYIEDIAQGVDPDAIVAMARASHVTATEVACRLARGAHCATLLVNGQIATTCWVSSVAEWLGEVAGWFVPPPGGAYVWDCATRPAFRGRHLYSILLRETLRRLSNAGYRYVWIATEWRNWKSARGVTRAGFRPVGVVLAVRLAIIRLQWMLPDPSAANELVTSLKDALSGHT